MNRFLYINFRKTYNILSIFRMQFYLFFGHIDKAKSIIHETFFYTPEIDKWIKITWLPNPFNDKQITNVNIGTIGVVEKVYKDGTFDLRINGDNGILLVGKKYKFIYFSPYTK
jgi:hypothetical protein